MTKVFRFKQFELKQENAAHKFGTDTMLLGSWASFPEAMNILDVGTGTGALALIMAQFHPEAIVDAVEIDPASAKEAADNFERSPWAYRLTVYQERIQDFCSDETLHYDLIICNPPYFAPINKNKGNNSQHGSESREDARQTNKLTFEELIEQVSKVLVNYGEFYAVLPHSEAPRFIDLAAESGLHLKKRLAIRDQVGTEVIRHLLCFSKQEGELQEEELVIYDANRKWTAEYKALTVDFHQHPDF